MVQKYHIYHKQDSMRANLFTISLFTDS